MRPRAPQPEGNASHLAATTPLTARGLLLRASESAKPHVGLDIRSGSTGLWWAGGSILHPGEKALEVVLRGQVQALWALSRRCCGLSSG